MPNVRRPGGGPVALRMRQRANRLKLQPPHAAGVPTVYTYSGQIDCFSGVTASYNKTKVPTAPVVAAQSTVVATYSKTKASATLIAAQSTVTAAVSKTKIPPIIVAGQSSVAAAVSKTKAYPSQVDGTTTVVSPYTKTKAYPSEVDAQSVTTSATQFISSGPQTKTYAGEIDCQSFVLGTYSFTANRPYRALHRDIYTPPVGLHHFGRGPRPEPPEPTPVVYGWEAMPAVRVFRPRVIAETQFVPAPRVFEVQGSVGGTVTVVGAYARVRVPVGTVRLMRPVIGAAVSVTHAPPTMTAARGKIEGRAHFEDWLEKVRAMDDELIELIA